jgi:hypothetical protein
MNPLSRQGVLTTPEEWMKHAESDFVLAQLARDNVTVLPSRSAFMHSRPQKKPSRHSCYSKKLIFRLLMISKN